MTQEKTILELFNELFDENGMLREGVNISPVDPEARRQLMDRLYDERNGLLLDASGFAEQDSTEPKMIRICPDFSAWKGLKQRQP